jgi:AraC-like DNA-binding protein
MAKTAQIRFLAPQAPPGLTAVRAAGIANAFPRHAHESCVLGVMTAGGRCIRLSGRQAVVPPGGVFVLSPGQAHACSPCGAETMSYLALGIPPALLAGPSGRQPVFAGPVLDDAELSGLLHGFFQSVEGDDDVPAALSAMLSRLMAHRLPDADPAQDPARACQLAAVREHLTRHQSRQVRLAELAQLADLSPFHLQRLFLRRYGQTPNEYLLRCRIRTARALIDRGLPLSEAALGAGFFDQSHFTRAFTRLVGVPPGSYRRSAVTPPTAGAREG